METLRRRRGSDQFLCSVCLELFTDPVSTPCGHNFCKSCISQVWESAPYRCPLCNEVFNTKPELRTNSFIKEMVSQFRLDRRDSKQLISVLCDMCSDPKLKLGLTLTLTLTLTLVGVALYWGSPPQRGTCPKHDRPLELFCRTDQAPVCVLCSVSEHRNHDIVSVKEAYEEQKASLQQTQAQTQLMAEQRRLKIQEIVRSLELSDKAVDRERASGLQAFSALIQSVQRRQQEFIEELQEQHKHTHTQAQELISELQQEIFELEKTSSELEQLSKTEDHLLFIQRHRELRPAVDMKDWKDWSTVHFETRNYEGSSGIDMAEVEESLTQEVKKLSVRCKLLRLQKFAVNVTLDPDTAPPYLALSEDLKQAHDTDVKKDLPDSPLRFNRFVCVLGKQGFSSGRFYFEVQVKGKTEWTLGVAQESINRKGKITLSPEDGYWTIWLRNKDAYIAASNSPVHLSPVRPPQKVGVFVDYSRGIVSFYDADSVDLLYSFTGFVFEEGLKPFFSPGFSYEGTNSSPLIITPV